MRLELVKIDLGKHDETYKTASSTRDFLYRDMFVNPQRLAKGNKKLINILIFDLPAVKSCLNCGSCAASCYALKAQRLYPHTKIMRDTNFYMSINDSETLKKLIIAQLDKTNVTTVRLHSSGDFYDQNYIDFWEGIIKLYPKIKFYAYTKVDHLFNFDFITSLDNFNLIESFIDGHLNYGDAEHVKMLQDKYKSFLCPATVKDSTVKCGKECSYCVTQSNVVFNEH